MLCGMLRMLLVSDEACQGHCFANYWLPRSGLLSAWVMQERCER